MKIYIERKIESKKDLPKKDGRYSVHQKGNVNPCDYHDSVWLGYIYKDAWIQNYDYWLDPIEADEGVEGILEKHVSIRGLLHKDNYDCVGIPYENAIKAMREYAAIQVAKDRAEHLLLDIKTQPSDEDIEEWAREQFMPSKDYSHLTEIQEAILICFKAGCSYGAKSALSGQIKKRK